jgi:hypothetical protein
VIISLKRKYCIDRPVIRTPYAARTGNSHGPTKDKRPSLQPNKRHPAGAKVFMTTPQRQRRREMFVDGWTGKRRMGDAS